MSRHNHDPNYVPMFPVDNVTMNFKGGSRGEDIAFRGRYSQSAGHQVHGRADADRRRGCAACRNGRAGRASATASIRSISGCWTASTAATPASWCCIEGRIRGGDAYFDYIGAYTAADGKWKGEIVNREHTPSIGERPLFGGHEVGIGFSGTYDDEGAEAEATALAGKRSIRFKAKLKKLA